MKGGLIMIRIRIPKERVGALIGKEGSIKSKIEELTGANLKIDSKTGEVEISFPKEIDDPLIPIKVERIIRAIGRGFSPEKALDLLSDDYVLEIIDLRAIFGDNKNAIRRIKGRIIGEGGKARLYIEKRTGAKISVYGHTVSIIGRYYNVIPAKEAIMALIEGKSHSSAYRRMEKEIAQLKEAQFAEKRLLGE